MQPWFDAERIAQLERAAQGWLGTPFHPHGMVPGPGGGCSCQSLAWALYVECGFLSGPAPRGSLRHFRTARESLIGRYLADQSDLWCEIRPIGPISLIAPGDLLYHETDACEHLAVALPHGRSIQCLMHCGVAITRLDDATWLQALKRIWRPLSHA
jgi:hypothetical protein